METYNNLNFPNRGINSTKLIEEDKSARRERREERKKERKEKKFSDESKDFNLNAFMDALSSLKNSIISQLTDCDVRIGDKQKGGRETAEKFKPTFNNYLAQVAALLGESQYRQNKGEGRKMEKGTADETTIKTFRDAYSKVAKDFTNTAEEYSSEIGLELARDIKKIKFKDIEEPLTSANKLFIEADSLSNDILKKIQEIGSQQAASGAAGGTGATGPDSKPSDIKIGKPISGTPTGENAELAKKVYALICEKWKDSKTLTATPQWKASGFCKPNKLQIGPNRSASIKAIKAYYGLDDKTGSITQELVDKLSASASIKENRSFKELNEGKLLGFNDFVKAKAMYEAEGGIDALKKSLESSNSGSSNKSSSGDKESVFKSKEEGDAFRKFVNDEFPEWAKKNKLDVSGSHTNSFIMKAWKKYKDDYNSDQIPEPVWKKIKEEIEKYGKVGLTESGAYELTFKDTDSKILLYKTRRITFNIEGREESNGTLSRNGESVVFDNGDKVKVGDYIKEYIKKS